MHEKLQIDFLFPNPCFLAQTRYSKFLNSSSYRNLKVERQKIWGESPEWTCPSIQSIHSLK